MQIIWAHIIRTINKQKNHINLERKGMHNKALVATDMPLSAPILNERSEAKVQRKIKRVSITNRVSMRYYAILLMQHYTAKTN